MLKYYISGGNRYGEANVLNRYGFVQVHDMEAADLVVFTGGADINPDIYGEDVHPQTYFSSTRDAKEIADFNLAKEQGKALLGICRGAQLLNCLVGGTLFQHIQHPGFHEVVTDEGERFLTNSVHHQMLRPAEGAIIKAWTENLSPFHEFVKDGQVVSIDDVEKEPEIVLYPQHRMVLVQGHPEFNSNDPELERFRTFVFDLVKEI